MTSPFIELAPAAVRSDLRYVAGEALRFACRDLAIAVPPVRWFDGAPPADVGGDRAYGFVRAEGPPTVWLWRGLTVKSAHRTVAHEARHVSQREAGDFDLGADANEADARRFADEFSKRYEWRF